MKVLLDTCVWGGARQALEQDGHEVEWTGDWEKDPGDEEILRTANEREAVLVTLDKDFGEMAIVRGAEHHGIIRLVGLAARDQGATTASVLARYADELARGAIVTVGDDRVRVRPGTRREET